MPINEWSSINLTNALRGMHLSGLKRFLIFYFLLFPTVCNLFFAATRQWLRHKSKTHSAGILFLRKPPDKTFRSNQREVEPQNKKGPLHSAPFYFLIKHGSSSHQPLPFY